MVLPNLVFALTTQQISTMEIAKQNSRTMVWKKYKGLPSIELTDGINFAHVVDRNGMFGLQNCPLDFHNQIGSPGMGDNARSIYHHLLDLP